MSQQLSVILCLPACMHESSLAVLVHASALLLCSLSALVARVCMNQRTLFIFGHFAVDLHIIPTTITLS